MKNLPLVIWLLGWTAVCTIQHRTRPYWEAGQPVPTPLVIVISAVIEIGIWIYVATLLYER